MNKPMIVDDNRSLPELLKLILEPEGFRVIQAFSGEECLEKLEKERPDCILLEMILSGMDGRGVLRAIKKNKDTASIPVAMLTVKPLTRETLEKKMERNLRYRVRDGDIYLVEEKKLDKGVDVFLDLLSSGYSGMIISRSRPEKIRELCKVEVPLLWLSEEVSDERAVYPELHFLEKIITDYATRDRVVLLDRLDYLIVKTSFKEVLGFIQRLNELFYRGRGVLIISMDPDTLSTQEYSLLEKETNEVKLRAEPNLPEDLWEILGFVRQQNILGKKPSHKEIVKQFNVTRTTARKRINMLGSMELVRGTKNGRYKVLELTEKGRTLWNSHN